MSLCTLPVGLRGEALATRGKGAEPRHARGRFARPLISP